MSRAGVCSIRWTSWLPNRLRARQISPAGVGAFQEKIRLGRRGRVGIQRVKALLRLADIHSGHGQSLHELLFECRVRKIALQSLQVRQSLLESIFVN